MAWTAYLTAIFAGLSLMLFLPRGRQSAPLSLLLPPIVAAALAGVYESMVPRSANIRVDLLVVVPVLAFVEGGFGIALAMNALARRRKELPFGASSMAAAICLAASGFVVLAWIVTTREGTENIARSDRGHELAFRAAFRDDATQRRFFGELEGDPDGWGGYYVPERADIFPRRIVIAADGRYWTYGQHEYVGRGHRVDPRDGTQFHGKGDPLTVAADIELAKSADGRVTLTRNFDKSVYTYAYRREPPPRFPRPPSASDKVKFRGVFSGSLPGSDWLAVSQIWLWEADGKVWGNYLWHIFNANTDNWVMGHHDARIDCGDRTCRELVVKVGQEQPARLTWISADELRLETFERNGQHIVLRRGEVVPGFIYDLAPLATVEENREWLRAVDANIHWTPAK